MFTAVNSTATLRQITYSKLEHTLYILQDNTISYRRYRSKCTISLESICYEDTSDCVVSAHISKNDEVSFDDKVSGTLKTRQISYCSLYATCLFTTQYGHRVTPRVIVCVLIVLIWYNIYYVHASNILYVYT